MKKILIPLFIFCSCDQMKSSTYSTATDSLSNRTETEIKDSLRIVINKEVNDKIYGVDSFSIVNSPIKILSAKPVEKDYSNYKDIHLVWKNVSKKNISAIKFRWVGLNAFGEPAEMGISNNGYGSGFSDDLLKPGKTQSGTWDILSRDLKKVTKAWAFQVQFEDGSKWNASNN